MDKREKQALIDKLNSMLTEDRREEEKLFIKLVQQVWEIDPYESLYSVNHSMRTKNIGYFLRFMEHDKGIDSKEMELIHQMLGSPSYYSSSQDLMDKLNQVRDTTERYG